MKQAFQTIAYRDWISENLLGITEGTGDTKENICNQYKTYPSKKVIIKNKKGNYKGSIINWKILILHSKIDQEWRKQITSQLIYFLIFHRF